MKKKVFKALCFNLIIIMTLLFVACKNKKSLSDLVSFEDETYAYDGEEKSIYVSNLPDGLEVEYTNNNQTEAGRYLVIAKIDGGKKYKDLKLEAYLTIYKASVEGITFNSKTVSYDGVEKNISCEGLPSFINASYVIKNASGSIVDSAINVGVYTFEASFTTTNTNYVSPSPLSATLTITKKDAEVYTMTSKSVVYDGNAHNILVNEDLKSYFRVSYKYYLNNSLVSECVNVGVYRVVASFESLDSNYAAPTEVEATLTIERASLDIVFNSDTITYDGNAHTIAVSSNALNIYNVTYNYYLNGEEVLECVNAGVYSVVASFETIDSNYLDHEQMVKTLTIAKASYDISDIVFQSQSFAYDGQSKSLVVSGTIPTGVVVSYLNNSLTEVGSITVTAVFSVDSNHNEIENMIATLAIYEGTIPNISFDSKTITYDGEAKYIYISGTLPEGVEVSYTNNGKTDVGTYTVIATLTDNLGNYETMTIEATLTIKKASYDMSGIKFIDATYTYDGLEKVLEIEGDLPEGVEVSYSSNKLTNAGAIVVIASFTGDSKNYNLIDSMTATLTIEKASYDMSLVSISDNEVVYDGSAKFLEIEGDLPDGVEVSYVITLNSTIVNSAVTPGEYVFKAIFSVDSNHNSIESISATLTIKKASIDVSLEDANYEYDEDNLIVRNAQIIGSLPTGVSAVYSYTLNGDSVASCSSLGVYMVVVTFESTTDYYILPTLTATLRIGYITYIDTDGDTDTIEYTFYAVSVDDLIEYLEAIEIPSGYASSGYYCLSFDDPETELVVADNDGFSELYDLNEIYEDLVYIDIYVTCTVTFDTLGNAEVAAVLNNSSVDVRKNDSVVEPTIITPAKNSYSNNYTFIGWYADSSCTELFDFSTLIDKNIIVYSKWEIIKISTAEEFIEYVSASSTCNAYIANDINLASYTIIRNSSSVLDSFSQFGTVLSHALYGNGYKVSNVYIDNSLTYGGLFGVLNGAEIYDIVFENVTYESTTNKCGLIAGTAKTNKSIIDGVTLINVNATVKSQFALLVGSAQASLEISNVAIKDSIIEGYSTVSGLVAEVTSSVIASINTILIDLDITLSGTNASFVIGSGSSNATILIDGAVLSGSLNASYAGSCICDASGAKTLTINNIMLVKATITLSSTTNVHMAYYAADNPTVTNIYYSNCSVLNSLDSTPIGFSDGISYTLSDAAQISIPGISAIYASETLTYTLNSISVSI